MRITREPIETTICTLAARRLGVDDVLIARHEERRPALGTDAGGVWFGLSLLVDGKWRFVGRRRTKSELLTIASTITVSELDGKHFGGCSRSARAVAV